MEDVAKAKDCYEKVVEYVTPPVNIIAVLLRLADLYIQCYEVCTMYIYMYIHRPGFQKDFGHYAQHLASTQNIIIVQLHVGENF